MAQELTEEIKQIAIDKFNEILDKELNNKLSSDEQIVYRRYQIQGELAYTQHVWWEWCRNTYEESIAKELNKDVLSPLICLKQMTRNKYKLALTFQKQNEYHQIPPHGTIEKQTYWTLQYLLMEVDNLKEEMKSLRDDLENQKSINVVLESELTAVRTTMKYTQDPGVPVGIIQRYWRSYVLCRNVKILAKQYEEQMLQEFRKNLVKGVSQNKVHEATNFLSGSLLKDVPQNKVCEAAENRKAANTLPKKLKPSTSDPRGWTERKANQVASDWMN